MFVATGGDESVVLLHRLGPELVDQDGDGDENRDGHDQADDAEQAVDGDHADGDCGGVHLDGARDNQGLDDVALDLVG